MVGLRCVAGCGGVICREGSRGNSAGGTTFLYIPLDGAFTTANGRLAASWRSSLPCCSERWSSKAETWSTHTQKDLTHLLLCLGLQVTHEGFFSPTFSPAFLMFVFFSLPCTLCCFIFHCHKKLGIPSTAQLRCLQDLEYHWFPFSPFHLYARLLRKVKIPVKWHVSKKHALKTLWGWLQNASPHHSHLQHGNFTDYSLKYQLRKLQCLSSDLHSENPKALSKLHSPELL